MDSASKMQALPLPEVRERLLNRRHDAFTCNPRRSDAPPDSGDKPAEPKTSRPAPPPLEERICAYVKCGVKFTPRRPDQHYHTADCRKRAWFDRNFAKISNFAASVKPVDRE